MVKKRGEGESEQTIAVNRGAWTAEEDEKLADYVRVHGDKNWRLLPVRAGLKRCGKSCRLRWLNYLRPGIKRGNITEDEEDLIMRLHNLLGNRWSLIAGRLPGRTDNEIKNYWNTHLSKKALSMADLNSKLHRRLEGTDGSVQELANISPVETSPVPVDTIVPPEVLIDAPSCAEEICRQVVNADEMLDLPVVLSGYHAIMFQPQAVVDEDLSSEDLAVLMDYRNYLLH